MMKKIPNPKTDFDLTKIPYHCLSPYVLSLMAVGQYEGNLKYGAFNWRKDGATLSVGYGAVLRHLNAVLSGEKIDPYTGIPHLVKAMTALHVMADADYHNTLNYDIENIEGLDQWEDFSKHCSELMKKIKDKVQDNDPKKNVMSHMIMNSKDSE